MTLLELSPDRTSPAAIKSVVRSIRSGSETLRGKTRFDIIPVGA
jgi:hypothetical protein